MSFSYVGHGGLDMDERWRNASSPSPIERFPILGCTVFLSEYGEVWHTAPRFYFNNKAHSVAGSI